LMTVLRSGDDGSNDSIERELESGGVIRVPDYEHIARSRLRVDIGMAASGASCPFPLAPAEVG